MKYIVVLSKEGYVVAPFCLQQDLVNFPDYDVLQDPAESTQNHGKVYFSVLTTFSKLIMQHSAGFSSKLL